MDGLDTAVFLLLNAQAASVGWLVPLARIVSYELTTGMVAVLALAALHPRWRSVLLRALLCMAVAWLVARLGQHALHLPRPAALGIGTQWVPHGLRAGFPSMHASVAFALYASLAQDRARLAWLAGLAAALIAWSRVCLGVHFPSDVLAGMLTGLLSSHLVWLALRHPRRLALQRRRRRLAEAVHTAA